MASAREHQIARLVADGLTMHAAVHKLGVARRAAIAALGRHLPALLDRSERRIAARMIELSATRRRIRAYRERNAAERSSAP
jgi:hypothetical protein